jgi:F0F1-type ATP synthase membrane subunit c/vacuolar-type H+-ATPase subunit K
MNDAQTTLKVVRIIHAVLLLVAVFNIWVAAGHAHLEGQNVPAIVPLSIGLVALSSVGIAVFFRARNVQPAAETLRNHPDDPSAVRRWRAGVIMSLAFCESIVIFGLVLRFIGVSWNVAGIFYAVGTLLMLAWTPKLDLPPQ